MKLLISTIFSRPVSGGTSVITGVAVESVGVTVAGGGRVSVGGRLVGSTSVGVADGAIWGNCGELEQAITEKTKAKLTINVVQLRLCAILLLLLEKP
jgi:hypothetical protein